MESPKPPIERLPNAAESDLGADAARSNQPRWNLPNDGQSQDPTSQLSTTDNAPPPITSPESGQSEQRLPQSEEVDAGGKPLWEDQRLTSGLISTIIHTLFLIVLAILTIERPPRGDQAILSTRGEPSEVVRLQVNDAIDQSQDDQSLRSEQTVKIEWKTITAPTQAIAPEQPGRTTSLNTLPDLRLNPASASLSIRLPGKAGLGKRNPQGRLEMGKKHGASVESERAVELALAYLAAHQRSNGSWSFDLSLAPCNGQCEHSKKENSGSATPVTAATGLALLAFLGAGHTHQESGPYQETVRRGIYFLRSIASEVEAGYDFQRGSMYGHGIALMALEEALCMTRDGNRYDSDLMELVQRGVDFSCIAQHDNGSWGYVPGRPGDVTITGWQVLSLIGARKGGAGLHTNTLPDAKSFLMSTCENRSFWFGYNSTEGEPTTSAIGLTLMLFLGESPFETSFAKSLDRIAKMGPLPNNIYHNYYASLALHHSRHPAWDKWNKQLRDHLVRTQVTQGHMKGSWHFPDKWGDVGGRLYTTALCAMTLEVYYRFMPLYESDDLFPL